ncbi:hypothetical protein H632_c38p3 [Helicosporidium sp. ATCC 50920]|nr:hypothetical protein H632_c38p3 [Helicosporidium sp. ATCC 50920]|eukprot:KDD77022.1 hypothetical protein H632_c38p3 [Helicosporidium sp. ATCC 50920]
MAVCPILLPPPSFQAFTARFKPYQGTLADLEYPSNYVRPAAVPEAGAAIPEKLTFNFFVPYKTVFDAEKVDMVLVPATTGDFGAMPGHVPTVAQLRPGVVTVHRELDKSVEKFFVPGGFAFVHGDSVTEVCAVDAYPLSDLDPDAVRAGLADYTAKIANLAGKADDLEMAQAQAGVEVYSAMASALGV